MDATIREKHIVDVAARQDAIDDLYRKCHSLVTITQFCWVAYGWHASRYGISFAVLTLVMIEQR